MVGHTSISSVGVQNWYFRWKVCLPFLIWLVTRLKKGVTDSAFPTMHLGMLLIVFIPNNTPIVYSVSVIDYPPPHRLYSQSPVHVIWIHLLTYLGIRNVLGIAGFILWYIYIYICVYFSFTYLFLAHKGFV